MAHMCSLIVSAESIQLYNGILVRTPSTQELEIPTNARIDTGVVTRETKGIADKTQHVPYRAGVEALCRIFTTRNVWITGTRDRGAILRYQFNLETDTIAYAARRALFNLATSEFDIDTATVRALAACVADPNVSMTTIDI